MNILQVASIMAQSWRAVGDDPPLAEWAANINDSEGWCFDCRYPQNEYTSDDGFTRVEGLPLNEIDLGVAVALAEHIMAGRFTAPVEMEKRDELQR